MVNITANLSRCLCYMALVVSGLISSIFTAGLFTTHEYNFTLLPLSLLFIALPLASLRSSIIIFTFLLPVFGNRPGSDQAFYLFFLASSVNTGAVISIFSKYKKFNSVINFNNPVITLSAIYVLCSAFSLTSLPLYELLSIFQSQFTSITDFTALSFALTDFVQATEEKISYSYLSLIWTLTSFNLTLAVYFICKSDRKNLTYITNAIFASLMLTITAGLFDYYSIINLQGLRKLDPVVNPQNIQFRLQSFFGHSGWFAEYATLTIPFVLVILRAPVKFPARLALIILILLLGEYTLILSFQRGGWISYPLTLLVIWAAIYIYQKLESSNLSFISALRKSLLKIAISIPLTLLATFIIFSGLSKFNIVNADRDAVVSRYVNRFSDITRSSDRTEFMKAGFLIGKLYPVLGAGSESFAYRFNKEFNLPDGKYYKQLNLPLYGSSHNVYMQIFSGKGFYGLLLLLSLIWYIIYSSIRLSLFENKNNKEEKLHLLSIASFCFAFLIYGNVQELFYIQTLQFLFFTIIGLAAALQPDTHILKHSTLFTIYLITLSLILLHTVWVVNKYKPQKAVSHYGCYRTEKDSKGVNYRWCGPRSLQSFKLKNNDGIKSVSFALETGFFRNSTEQSEIQIYSGDKLLFTEKVSKQKKYNISIELPEDSELKSQDEILLNIVSEKYFIPARDYKRSKDNRLLSYKLYQ